MGSSCSFDLADDGSGRPNKHGEYYRTRSDRGKPASRRAPLALAGPASDPGDAAAASRSPPSASRPLSAWEVQSLRGSLQNSGYSSAGEAPTARSRGAGSGAPSARERGAATRAAAAAAAAAVASAASAHLQASHPSRHSRAPSNPEYSSSRRPTLTTTTPHTRGSRVAVQVSPLVSPTNATNAASAAASVNGIQALMVASPSNARGSPPHTLAARSSPVGGSSGPQQPSPSAVPRASLLSSAPMQPFVPDVSSILDDPAGGGLMTPPPPPRLKAHRASQRASHGHGSPLFGSPSNMANNAANNATIPPLRMPPPSSSPSFGAAPSGGSSNAAGVAAGFSPSFLPTRGSLLSKMPGLDLPALHRESPTPYSGNNNGPGGGAGGGGSGLGPIVRPMSMRSRHSLPSGTQLFANASSSGSLLPSINNNNNNGNSGGGGSYNNATAAAAGLSPIPSSLSGSSGSSASACSLRNSPPPALTGSSPLVHARLTRALSTDSPSGSPMRGTLFRTPSLSAARAQAASTSPDGPRGLALAAGAASSSTRGLHHAHCSFDIGSPSGGGGGSISGGSTDTFALPPVASVASVTGTAAAAVFPVAAPVPQTPSPLVRAVSFLSSAPSSTVTAGGAGSASTTGASSSGGVGLRRERSRYSSSHTLAAALERALSTSSAGGGATPTLHQQQSSTASILGSTGASTPAAANSPNAARRASGPPTLLHSASFSPPLRAGSSVAARASLTHTHQHQASESASTTTSFAQQQQQQQPPPQPQPQPAPIPVAAV